MSTEDPITQTQDPDAVERALRAGLEDFELSDEDRALLERGDDALDAEARARPAAGRRRRRPPERRQVDPGQPDHRPPRGRRRGRPRRHPRPRRLRRRVGGPPRSRSSTPAAGSIDATGIHLRVAEQAEIAVDLADAVLFVVDATVGATDDDENCRQAAAPGRQAGGARRQQGRRPAHRGRRRRAVDPGPGPAVPRLGAARPGERRRCSTPSWRCCPRSPPIGGATSAVARAASRCSAARTSASPRCSTSSSGDERVVVDEVAGTTRDPVDELIELGGKTWRFVDTAGIRRRVHQTRGPDFYASLRTQTALEKAEVAVVLVDASETISEQDVRVIQQVIDAGRALVIAYNKWDLTDEERRHYLEREIERDLVQIAVGAAGQRLGAAPAATWTSSSRRSRRALESWETRIPTGRLNAFLGELVAAHPHPVRGGKQPRILFAHPGGHPPAAVRALRVRLHRGRLPPLRRAPAARGVRLRRHPDRDLGAGAREALPPLTSGGCRAGRGRFGRPGAHGIRFRRSRKGAATGCGAAW